jgi:hypothetical protein
MRTFSLQEAQTMLPILEGLLRKCIDGKKLIETVDRELASLGERIFYSGGSLVDLKRTALRRAEREKAVQRLRDAMAEIDAIGVQVKDLDIGLLDFPCKVDDEIVLLCWKLGEPGITHWHGMQEGFAGRKPIDERILRAEPGEVN